MSNFDPSIMGGNQQFDLRERAEQLANKMEATLKAAVEIVAPGSNSEVSEVFGQPTERRDDDPGLALTAEQDEALRTVAAELGWGRRSDRTPDDQGLKSGYVAIIEGGQPHKVRAELDLVAGSQPGVIYAAGSPNRKVVNDAERQSGAQMIGVDSDRVGATEYDVVKQVIQTTHGFEAAEEEILSASYEISEDHQVGDKQNGQFVKIGRLAGADVVLVRIDREDYTDDEGAAKYRNQPGSAEVMGIVHNILIAEGDDSSQLGFVTSHTYEPSRTVDAVRAGLTTGRQAEVVSYGSERLGAVRGIQVVGGPINQLPGELRKASDNLVALRSML